MKRRWFIYIVIILVIAIVPSCFLIYGNIKVKYLFNNLVGSYQINKYEVWIFITFFSIILLFVKIISVNISRRRDAETSLSNNELILRATLNSSSNGILVVDNNSKVLNANDLYYKMWGIPWNVNNLFNEYDNLKFIKKQIVDSNSFEAWVNYIYKISVSEYYIAHLIDGRIFNVLSTPLTDKGNMIGRVWRFSDITIRVNTESELQKSEERYRAFVELSPDAIFVIMRKEIVFSNITGVKMLGAASTKDIYERDIKDFIYSESEALIEKHFNDIINGREKNLTYEYKLMRLDGKSIDIEAVFSRIPYKGENAVMCMVRDISERKRNEELKHKMDENMKLVRETLEYDRIKTEFFSNISHEIKTPLNIIIGTLQLIELVLNGQSTQVSFDKLTKYAAIMRQNCFRLLRMLSNLIYITEIDSGFVEMHIQNHDLVQIIKDITSVAGRFIESKGLKFSADIYDSRLMIACDDDKIERVLLNLLSNAVKFTEKGGRIIVSLYSRDGYACISVKDTGIGIPDEMKRIIFQRFRQVDKSFTRRCEGSGIGLSLSKSIVEMHGGEIELNSEYGKGSEFIIKLPLLLAEGDEIAVTCEGVKNVWVNRVDIEFSDIY